MNNVNKQDSKETYTLEDSISKLKLVGPRRAFLLNKIGIYKIKDLLLMFPKKFLNYSNNYEIKPGENLLSLSIKKKYKYGNLWAIDSLCENLPNGMKITMLFFHQKNLNMFQLNKQYFIYGKLEIINDKFFLKNITIINEQFKNKSIPVYGTSISNLLIHKMINEIIVKLDNKAIFSNNSLYDLPNFSMQKMLYNLHNNIDYEITYNFLKLIEACLFIALFKTDVQLDSLEKIVAENEIDIKKIIVKLDLPFNLNNDQNRAIEEIIQNLYMKKPMKHMLFAEVGAGKTIISLIIAIFMIKTGYKVAFLAPTIALLNQHINSFKLLLENMNINMYCVGQINSKKDHIPDNAQFIIGTHALLYRNKIENLGLVIIDEMQKFGVLQRASLIESAARPNLLMLSATPIPRSLNILLDEFMSFSQIKESVFKKDTETIILQPEQIDNIINKIIQTGKKAYWVLPNIEESTFNIGAIKRYEYINQKFKNTWLLHGRMKHNDQIDSIENFKNSKDGILIATTMIEIGIDIPDSEIIIIESPERFGLSQLHQLRGRVGRRGQKSYCILLSKEKYKKLTFFKEHNNGLEIAEYDLKLRGSGKLIGLMQHGHFNNPSGFMFLNENDKHLLSQAKALFSAKLYDKNLPIFELFLALREIIH